VRQSMDLQASEQTRTYEAEGAKEQKLEASKGDAAWVEAATKDMFTWVTQHTQTYNEHWKEEGRPCARHATPECIAAQTFAEHPPDGGAGQWPTQVGATLAHLGNGTRPATLKREYPSK
jgi:uncharacterized protein YycO